MDIALHKLRIAASALRRSLNDGYDCDSGGGYLLTDLSERIGETMDVILRAARQVIKPELVLDPPEPEVYVLAGKKLLVVTMKRLLMPWSTGIIVGA